MRQHRHSNTQVAFTTRSYCLDSGVCSYPGPTIRIKPGDKFTLILVNELGENPSHNNHVHNTMHSPNTTNIHTHGLHVDPDVVRPYALVLHYIHAHCG